MKNKISLCLLLLMNFYAVAHAEMVAKITTIEGTVQLLRNGSSDWQNVKPGMPLQVGDQVFTQQESFAEIRYSIGTVLRMDEKTKITLESSSEKTLKTKSAIGNVWVNMRKLISTGKEFEVATPTAVAAIRGTVYNMSTADDSASAVSVYEGKVAVGPSDELKKKLDLEGKKKSAKAEQPTEISGPEEIPGPFEVSLEQWRSIVAGQKISVRNDGKFSQEKFDSQVTSKQAFVKKNLELDKVLMKDKNK